MSLDTRFVPVVGLQQYFVDKTTGLPLSNGQVFFYRDASRSTLKTVYEIQETPAQSGTFTYTALPNPVPLDATGSFSDNNGNNILPYFFPYDGTQTTSAGTLDLYYIVVQDQNGVTQFTREALPNLAPSNTNSGSVELTNFAPNGQFLLNNPGSHLVTTQFTYTGLYGNASIDVAQIAPGGWTMEKNHGSTAVDTISFSRQSQFVAQPNSSPRYLLNWTRSGLNADSVCDIRIKFMDVNKFANQTFTLLFFGQSVSGSSLQNVNISLIKYFGSGATGVNSDTVLSGSPIVLNNNTWQQYAITVPFGNNGANQVGSNDDDFIQLAIRLPCGSNQTFSVQFCDFMLTPGIVAGSGATIFPANTNGEFILEALSNLAPTTVSNTTSSYYQQDGSNLYLPIIMTASGFTYDYSQIGKVYASFSTAPENNELLADGSQIDPNGYSTLGIPFKRLFNKWFNNSINAPIFGTGATFVTANAATANTAKMILNTNQAGAVTSPANGAISPGFTYAKPVAGTSTIGYRASTNGGSQVTAFQTAANTSHSGSTSVTFTIADLQNSTLTGFIYGFTLTSLSAATLANPGGAGKFFQFSSNSTSFYMWFFFTNETDPAPGGTGIKIDLSSYTNASATDIAKIISAGIAAQQVDIITMGSGATIPAGSFFTFQANGVTYTPWYKVSGSGTAPASPNPIEVDITTADTAATVVLETQKAINSKFFALPDLRGAFLRGVDTLVNPIWDLDVANRYGLVNSYGAQNPGSFEWESITSHTHAVNQQTIFATGAVNNTIGSGDNSTNHGATTLTNAASGGTGTRPVNMSVNWYIKY